MAPRTWAAWTSDPLEVRAVPAFAAGAALPRSPLDRQAQRVLDRILERLGQSPADMLRAFDDHDPRAERFWELIAVIRDQPWPSEPTIAYRWIESAVRQRR